MGDPVAYTIDKPIRELPQCQVGQQVRLISLARSSLTHAKASQATETSLACPITVPDTAPSFDRWIYRRCHIHTVLRKWSNELSFYARKVAGSKIAEVPWPNLRPPSTLVRISRNTAWYLSSHPCYFKSVDSNQDKTNQVGELRDFNHLPPQRRIAALSDSRFVNRSSTLSSHLSLTTIPVWLPVFSKSSQSTVSRCQNWSSTSSWSVLISSSPFCTANDFGI